MEYVDRFIPKSAVYEMNKKHVYQLINEKILNNKRNGVMSVKFKLSNFTLRDKSALSMTFVHTFLEYHEEFIEELRESGYEADIMDLPVESEDGDNLYIKQKADFLVIDWEY